KKFRLGSRFARLFAFFIDGMLLASILLVLFLLLEPVGFGLQIGLLSALLWILGPKTKLPIRALVLAQVLLVFLLGPLANNNPATFALSGIALWAVGMSLMDGFKNGQGLGKKLLSLQVLRLKDGKPCSFKDFNRWIPSGHLEKNDSGWGINSQRQLL
ncbi:RDD family protein, partial [Candidatus Poribacteria bacterium]|nr:RDD family protein [Candidatus Poribacteria bacterium]